MGVTHDRILTYLLDNIWDGKKQRKKERQTPEANEKMKMRVASGGIRTHDNMYM